MFGKRTLVFFLLCGAGILAFNSFARSTPTLEIKIIPNKISFRKGEVAHLEFRLVGTFSLFSEPVTIPSLNHQVTIVGPTGVVYSKREFIHRAEPVTLRRGSEMKLGELDWNLLDLSGKPVPKGVYKIVVSLSDYQLQGEISIEILDT